MLGLRVGIGFAPFESDRAAARPGAGVDVESRRRWAAAQEAHLDHVVFGDHVSFRGGLGADGLIEASIALGATPGLHAHLAVYLLALRHPVLVARQLASVALLAPGRLHLGIGVGGEDRDEFRSVGVDPGTRGRRTDESLEVLTQLMGGDPVTFHGRHFHLDEVAIRPAPTPRIPITIGGRSEAALDRVARFGDGWIAAWVSPDRFLRASDHIAQRAEQWGRATVAWDHGLLAWCGLGVDRRRAETTLASTIQAVYGVDFERFRRYSPMGNADDVAESLEPYVRAGARHFDLIAVGAQPVEAAEVIGRVRRLLLASVGDAQPITPHTGD